ncbi:uncharacterized protein LOC114252723 [Bombyx mandarina]|uniref:Regulatory protein zeste n=1 Tax=Bombyx mandarina TaxID=7092 RepID=A0A6J2KLB4_BOMMA|nr:uncharacterized protein LOC114252723 [Bombyx mandarina]
MNKPYVKIVKHDLLIRSIIMEFNLNNKKRQRSENWIAEDKCLLKELVRGNLRYIENKNTDNISNRNKQKSWEDLQFRFNSACKGKPRTVAQLKAQWAFLKMYNRKHKTSDMDTSSKKIPNNPENDTPQDDVTLCVSNRYIDSSDCDSNSIPNDKPPRDTKVFPDLATVIEVQHLEEPKKIEQTNDETLTSNKTNKCIEELMMSEILCRKVLLELQMENERKKSRNLDLKHKILENKLLNAANYRHEF